jgi:Tfp pilus assembly protein PilE
MRPLNRQKGMTAIGWLIVLALIGFFVLLTLKMLPSYLEYYKIVSTLDSLRPGISII